MEMKQIIQNSIFHLPEIEGPIPVSGESYPFCDMLHSRTPLDVSEYGFVEEEYFISGTANVYDTDENDMAVLYKAALPYKTRILVRRPKEESKFSGRVYIDIMNATQGYDIEDLWHRNYLWCMENGHAYIGITSKPVNVLALKNFDYQRYKDLNWSNGEKMPMPVPSFTATIPGTEEGLFWDMLGQLAYLVRNGGEHNGIGGYQAEYLYLTGQSQSGAYLNTYISYFDSYLYDENGKGLFDGYLNIVGALVQRSIRQAETIGPLRLTKEHIHPSRTPFIRFSSEADLYLFKMFVGDNLLDMKVENSNSENDKCRYYEIAGSPHTDIICPVLSANSEIKKMGGKMPNLDECLLEHINDMRIEFYVCGMLEKLHIWASQGIAPEECEPLVRENGDLARDEYGNALGGLRTPYVDIPVASYIASNPDDPEGICGKMTYFTKTHLKELYNSREEYIERFTEYVSKQAEEHWISESDGKKMIEWACQVPFE